MTRLAPRLVGLLVTGLVLAGCRLDVAVRVDVGKDGSGTVTVTATADRELVAKAPGVPTALRLDDARAAGWQVQGPTKSSSGGASVVLTKPFATPAQATAILAEINGPRGPLRGMTVTQERAFARVTTSVRGTIRVDGGVAALSDDALTKLLGPVGLANALGSGQTPLDQALRFELTAKAPGTVVESNGAAAPGGAVTWQPSLGDGHSTPVAATFEEHDRTAERDRTVSTWTARAIVAWVVLFALIVLVTVVVLRRRRARRAAGHPGTW